MIRKSTSKIILHCSDSKRFKDRIADIRRWQMDPKFPAGALPDVAYHYFIGSDGLLEIGLPENQIGYHTKGENHCSVAICLNGPTFELVWPNPNQLYTLESLLINLKATYPLATLHAHNEFRKDKTCPGFNINGMKRFWDRL